MVELCSCFQCGSGGEHCAGRRLINHHHNSANNTTTRILTPWAIPVVSPPDSTMRTGHVLKTLFDKPPPSPLHWHPGIGYWHSSIVFLPVSPADLVLSQFSACLEPHHPVCPPSLKYPSLWSLFNSGVGSTLVLQIVLALPELRNKATASSLNSIQ
jgi:hypothetical protein